MATIDQHPTDDRPPTTETPHEEHGTLARNGVDPHAEPSAEWGWHGTFPRATAIAGWITAASMFLMLIGNHQNYVEDVWLIVLGTLLVIMLLGGAVSRSRARRR